MTPSRQWTRASLGLLLALSATRAEAHAVFSTAGPFFGGIKHFFLSPEDVLLTIGFGLLAGLRGPKPAGAVVVVLPGAWIVAGVAALLSGTPERSGEIPSACSLMAVGLLVAADRGFRPFVLVGLGILLGGLHGFLNGTAMSEAGSVPALKQLGGVVTAVLVVGFYFIAVLDLVNLAKRSWVRIVARVMGSWIAASGLLLLGWSLRPHR